jgi:hypothetical protein
MQLHTYAGKERPASKPSSEHHDPHATLACLASLGVPAHALARAPRREWRNLQADLDRFYAYGYGGATQETFMHSPHPRLHWETPTQVLGRRDGIHDVRAALRATLHSLRVG